VKFLLEGQRLTKNAITIVVETTARVV